MLSEEHRLALAIAVYEKKDILFGKLAPGITMKVRASAWMQIMGQLNALGARIEKIDDIRDTAWSYMKKKAKERFLESLHTGSGASQMTLVDERVMDTVGRSTANVRGLQIPDVEVSFAPSTVMPYDELFIYPQASEVRVEQNVHQDLVQAGPSGQQNSNADLTLQDSIIGLTSTPSTRSLSSASQSVAPPSKPTYSGRKSKRGEALLDDQNFVDFKKSKIQLELSILESQSKEIVEKSELEKQLLAQQVKESAARTSYFIAATKAINLKICEPFETSLNED